LRGISATPKKHKGYIIKSKNSSNKCNTCTKEIILDKVTLGYLGTDSAQSIIKGRNTIIHQDSESGQKHVSKMICLRLQF